MASSLSALVLAAGRSTRMGTDKALLEVDGVPLWRRQRDTLAALQPVDVLLSVRGEQEWARHVTGFNGLVFDMMPDCGPIAGVCAGLERTSAPLLAVLAIDLPRMTTAWFQRLLARCTPQKGAVARRGGYFEPLAAIYPADMKWLVWETIARGEYSLQALLTAAEKQGLLEVVEISAQDEPLFANWNEGPPAAQ